MDVSEQNYITLRLSIMLLLSGFIGSRDILKNTYLRFRKINFHNSFLDKHLIPQYINIISK